MFALGASQALYGPFFPYFSRTLGVTPAQLGLVPGVHFGGATAGVILGGLFAQRRGYRWLLNTGGAILSMGYAAVAFAASWTTLLAGAGLLGFGFGLLVNFNILIDEAFGRLGAAALQLINAAFSIGAISAPLIAVVSLEIGGQTTAFLVGGVVSAALTTVLVLHRSAADHMLAEERRRTGADGSPNEGGNRRALLVPVALFLPLYLVYPGAEASFSNWMPTHLFSLLSVAAASAVTSGFWLAFTVGRLAAVPLSTRLQPSVLVVAAIAVSTVGAVAATVDGLAPVAYLVAGFALGPVFPGGLSWLRSRYPRRAGEASSIIIAAGGVGGMVLPPLVGLVVDRAGAGMVPVALSTVMVFAIFMALIIAVSGRTRGSAKPLHPDQAAPG